MNLLETITTGAFNTLGDLDAVNLFGIAFGSELRWLKTATPTVESSKKAPSIGALGGSNCSTPSYILYGCEYAEVNRSLTSMLAVKWLLAEDYEKFTWCQNPARKLTPESFRRLRDLLVESCPGPDYIYALIVALAVNDLGKSNDLATVVANTTGGQTTLHNHDDVVYEAAKKNLLPSLSTMEPATLRLDVLLGLEMGSRFNIAQLAQAECPAASVEHVTVMRGRERAFGIKIMEVILDVAGASGHVDWRGAAQMTEPVFRTYLVVCDALREVVSGQISPRQGYECVLQSRVEMLREAGFEKNLLIHDPAESALVRLLTMGRVVDVDTAECFTQAFENLSPATRQRLINALNLDGTKGGRETIFFSYAPELVSEALKNTKVDAGHRITALGALMQFLARIYAQHEHEQTHVDLLQRPDPRDVSVAFAQDTVKSAAFRKNPRLLLENLCIPTCL